MEWWPSRGLYRRWRRPLGLLVVGLVVVSVGGCGLLSGSEDAPADATVVAGATVMSKAPAKATLVALTNDTWHLAVEDADRYQGSPVDLTGQIFNVLGDYDGAAHYQLFTDPQARAGNTHLAVPPGNLALLDGDVIRIVGTLDHMLVTTSRGGVELRLPYVVADTIEVLAGPTAALITPTPLPTPTSEPTAVPTPTIESTPVATPTITATIDSAPVKTATATSATPTSTPTTATTAAPTALPSPATHFNVEIREDITVSGSMTNIGDANSPSGHYFAGTTSTREWNGSGAAPNNAAAANFVLEVPSDDRYAVWVRMQYQNIDANSLWLRVDDGKAVLLGNEDSGYGTWKWVAWRDGNQSNRVLADLKAGRHTLTLISRETGTRFDSVLVTDDTTYQPPTPVSIATQLNPAAPTPAPAPATSSAALIAPTSPATAIPASPTAMPAAPTTAPSTPTPKASSPTPAPAAATAQPTPTTSQTSPTATAQATATKASSGTATPQATATKPPSPTATPHATATKVPSPIATSAPTSTPVPASTRVATDHPGSYTVKQGDTLSGIAQQIYGDASQYQRIYEANRDKLSSPDRIATGAQLTIPK